MSEDNSKKTFDNYPLENSTDPIDEYSKQNNQKSSRY